MCKGTDRSHSAKSSSSSSNSPLVLKVTVAAVGGRLFFLMCFVNLRNPLPNCSGTLILWRKSDVPRTYYLDRTPTSNRGGNAGELFSALHGLLDLRKNPNRVHRTADQFFAEPLKWPYNLPPARARPLLFLFPSSNSLTLPTWSPLPKQA